MTRRRRQSDGATTKRRKGLRRILTNADRTPTRRFLFENPETKEQVAITQVSTHHGRTSQQYTHYTPTRAGGTQPHPLQTKPRRRAAAKQARASRKANRG